MVDVKQAIANARASAGELLGTHDLLLEEVESHPDEFEITLRFPSRPGATPLNPLMRPGTIPREYKTFHAKKDSGEVTSMQIRLIA